MLLTCMKETAETHLSSPATSAVITVPVYISFAQRRAVEVAATAAALRVLRLISEPSGSAVAYGMDMVRPAHAPQVLMLDVRGSINVALFTVEDGVIEVRASTGVPHRGGDDFDALFVAHVARQFQREHGRDVSGNARALRRLRMACKSARRTLSVCRGKKTNNRLSVGWGRFLHYRYQGAVQGCLPGPVRAVLEPIKKVLHDVHIDEAHVDKVALVGSSTWIPAIAKLISTSSTASDLPPSDPSTRHDRRARRCAPSRRPLSQRVPEAPRVPPAKHHLPHAWD